LGRAVARGPGRRPATTETITMLRARRYWAARIAVKRPREAAVTRAIPRSRESGGHNGKSVSLGAFAAPPDFSLRIGEFRPVSGAEWNLLVFGGSGMRRARGRVRVWWDLHGGEQAAGAPPGLAVGGPERDRRARISGALGARVGAPGTPRPAAPGLSTPPVRSPRPPPRPASFRPPYGVAVSFRILSSTRRFLARAAASVPATRGSDAP